MSLLNYVLYVLSLFTCLRASVSSCLTCLPALHAFAPFVPYSRALSVRFVSLFQVPYTPYLCALDSFDHIFVVQQKLLILHRLSKRLHTVLFLCGSKTVAKLFRREIFFKTWNKVKIFVFFFSYLQTWSYKFFDK